MAEAAAEARTGQGSRYRSLIAAADRARADADAARARVESAARDLAAARANVPPHLAAIRLYLPAREREAMAVLNLTIAALISLIAPALAATLRPAAPAPVQQPARARRPISRPQAPFFAGPLPISAPSFLPFSLKNS